MTYDPQWEGVIEAYSRNQISKNLWKYSMLDYEFDDLLHEAVLVFLYCRNRYVVNSPAHFMSLYKKALHDTFYDLAKKSSGEKDVRLMKDVDTDFGSHGVCEESSFRVLLKKAPKEVKQVLSLALNAPTEILDAIGFTKKSSKSFSANKKLCQLLGYDSNQIDLVGRVKDYFSL